MNIDALINGLPGAAAQGLIWGIVAIGIYITYKILDIADLTVDGSLGTGGAVCVMMMLAGYSNGMSLAAAFVIGMVTGLVTGLLHTIMGIPAILAGILTQLGLYSVNLKIMGSRANTPINPNNYDLLVSLRNVKNVPFYENAIFITAVITLVIVAILYLFFGTEFGCTLRATGGSAAMCRAQGVNVEFNKVVGLTISNGLVAFAGGLLAQYQGFADVNMGRGAIVIGLAAVVIGEAIFGRIFSNFALNLIAMSLGSIIYYLVLQVVIWRGLDPQLLKLLSAIIVAIFLAIPYFKGKYFNGVILARHSGSEKGDAENAGN